MADRIEFHRVGEEWTAVYLNEQLQRVGASYLADEWLQQHVGVVTVYDSPCMRDSHHAYPTLTEVREARAERDRKLEQAADLRAEAQHRLELAAQLEKEAKG